MERWRYIVILALCAFRFSPVFPETPMSQPLPSSSSFERGMVHLHLGIAQTQLGLYAEAAASLGRAMVHGYDKERVNEAMADLEDAARSGLHIFLVDAS